MAKFRAHVSIDSTSATQAAADLVTMSRASSNKTVLVEWIEGREGG